MSSTRAFVLASAAAAATLVATANVQNIFALTGDPTTGLQNSGFECVPTTQSPTTFYDRSARGFENTGGPTMSIFCPLTRPSDDSISPVNGMDISKTLDQLEVHYTIDMAGQPAPTCMVVERDSSTGSVGFSAALPVVVSPISGATVLSLASRNMTGVRSVWGLSCSLPSLTTIKGVIGRAEHGQVSDGT